MPFIFAEARDTATFQSKGGQVRQKHCIGNDSRDIKNSTRSASSAFAAGRIYNFSRDGAYINLTQSMFQMKMRQFDKSRKNYNANGFSAQRMCATPRVAENQI